ncbi:hypothetical protein J31TS6_57300 [Brevibacillus reuszeri]|uniref:helix-turn-helix domain-containing protein n=1 Tax=Brevibacillus reuszeri TaxID=54915 RepID=UPI001B244747|nr:helix-turn-helix transcriptional regulator [Brevibacillus reuszeri]GIO09702.1 hypothetical protein J31TS6_57300 [Brevibacillus reuszeri]
MSILGERIKDLRLKKNLKQDEIAEMLGMKRSNFSSYETGRTIPPSNILSELATILGTSTDYLLGKTSNPLPIYFDINDSIRYFLKLITSDHPSSSKIQSDLWDSLDRMSTKHSQYNTIKINMLSSDKFDQLADAIVFIEDQKFKSDILLELKTIAHKYYLWDDPSGHLETKINSDPFANEKEFLSKIDLSDEELLAQFKLTVDGRDLTVKEIKKLLAFLRMERNLDLD